MKTIGRFDETAPINARGYFVQNAHGATVAGPFTDIQAAWAEEKRLAKQAEAEADRDGALPADPVQALRAIALLWHQAEIDRTIIAYRVGAAKGLDDAAARRAEERISEARDACNELVRLVAMTIVHGVDYVTDYDPIRGAASACERVAKDTWRSDCGRMANRAAFLRLLAADVDRRMAREIPMDHPLPILP